jgi:hypothetical protein
MNKIVREHYPVERLPEDLREAFPDVHHVTVEVSAEAADDAGPPPLSYEEAVAVVHMMRKRNAERGGGVTEEEAVRRIRELRDEWDD